jgi:hypothetical protein
MKKKFPMLAVILLVVALLWLLTDLQVISINIPWIPLILIIIALGMIVNKIRSN